MISVGVGLFLTTLFGWLAQLAFQGGLEGKNRRLLSIPVPQQTRKRIKPDSTENGLSIYPATLLTPHARFMTYFPRGVSQGALMPESRLLADLVYLDWERASGHARRPTQIARPGAGAKATTALPNPPPETRSSAIHDFHIALEESLVSQGKTHRHRPAISSTSPAGPSKPSATARLLRISGMVRLLDYPWLSSVMETLPRMLKVTHRAELSALKQKREAHQITQAEVDLKVKEQQAQLKDLENWKMEELTEFVRELFGQSVRIKVIPYGSKSGEMLVGSCQPSHFFDPPAILSQKLRHRHQRPPGAWWAS